MGLKIKLITLILGFVFFLFVLRVVKRNHFRPNFAIYWVLLCSFLISIPLLEPLYKWIAVELIGIFDARHIIYVSLIGFLLVYVFYLTIRVTRMSDQIQELITFTAILENEMDQAKQPDKDNRQIPGHSGQSRETRSVEPGDPVNG